MSQVYLIKFITLINVLIVIGELADSSPIILTEGHIENNSPGVRRNPLCFIRLANGNIDDSNYDSENGPIDGGDYSNLNDEKRLAIANLQCFLSKLNQHMLVIGRPRYG